MNLYTFTLGIIICFLLSFALGLERQTRKRSVGLRTMILVAIGSYMFVSFSFLVTGYNIDISRVASQVVAGIGFLGAGVIIKDNEKNKIKGLTTAATLWCDAAIGVLCAAGFIYEAIISSILVLFSNAILRYFDALVNKIVDNGNIDEVYRISINSKDSKKILKTINNYEERLIEIFNYKVENDDLTFDIKVKKENNKKINIFINYIVTEHNIKKYEYTKISESLINKFEEL